MLKKKVNLHTKFYRSVMFMPPFSTHKYISPMMDTRWSELMKSYLSDRTWELLASRCLVNSLVFEED